MKQIHFILFACVFVCSRFRQQPQYAMPPSSQGYKEWARNGPPIVYLKILRELSFDLQFPLYVFDCHFNWVSSLHSCSEGSDKLR